MDVWKWSNLKRNVQDNHHYSKSYFCYIMLSPFLSCLAQKVKVAALTYCTGNRRYFIIVKLFNWNIFWWMNEFGMNVQKHTLKCVFKQIWNATSIFSHLSKTGVWDILNTCSRKVDYAAFRAVITSYHCRITVLCREGNNKQAPFKLSSGIWY